VEYDQLSIKVYDYDSGSNNDLLGEIDIPVAVLAATPAVDKWYQLQHRTGPTTFHPAKGEIKVCVFDKPSVT
jgi:hypothetical protein